MPARRCVNFLFALRRTPSFSVSRWSFADSLPQVRFRPSAPIPPRRLGYQIYALSDHQVSIPGFEVIIPDRSGYGQSTKPSIFNAGFHRLAVAETLAFMDALGIEQPILWGHSDGAVISAWMALLAPQRSRGIILEAVHYDRAKPHSREFFETMVRDPEAFGERVTAILAADHGPAWRDCIRGDGEAWLQIAALQSPHPDIYEGRLSEINTPVAIIHGANDPRTEPDELNHVFRELPAAQQHVIAGAGHSPHSERGSQQQVTERVHRIVEAWAGLVKVERNFSR
jgi:pimeloyl-ACP methyl ester carboxylesterase